MLLLLLLLMSSWSRLLIILGGGMGIVIAVGDNILFGNVSVGGGGRSATVVEVDLVTLTGIHVHSLNDRYWRRRRRRRRGGWPWWRRRGGCHGHRRQHFDIATSTTSWFAIIYAM